MRRDRAVRKPLIHADHPMACCRQQVAHRYPSATPLRQLRSRPALETLQVHLTQRTHRCAEQMPSSKGGARITHWQSVWLFGSKGTDTAVRHPSDLHQCRAVQGTPAWALAGLQALEDDFSRSQHAVDLRKYGAKGIRTPDLLHAMQVGQLICQLTNRFCLRRQCPEVPVSACQPVDDGCPLGCPLVRPVIMCIRTLERPVDSSAESAAIF